MGEQIEVHSSNLLSMWLKERTIQNQSEHTISAYQRDLTDFFHFCEVKKLQLQDIEASDLREYLAERVERDQLSSSSLQRHLTSIRQFMKWAEQGQYLVQNPSEDFKLKRQPRPLPGMIDIETINQILDQAAPEKILDHQLWLRDKAMLELLYSSGLRLAELQGLSFKDIDFNRMLLRITGKGNKTRIVPFGQKAKDSLLLWMSVYRIWQGDLRADFSIFISKKGQTLTPVKLKIE